jgi:hypothetical protein
MTGITTYISILTPNVDGLISLMKIHELGQVAETPACNPRNSGDRDQEVNRSKPVLCNQFARPYLENTQQKIRTGLVAQVVEWLLSKCEPLNSKSSAEKKEERKKIHGLD